MVNTNLRVYVSSTSIDLKEHRAAVIAALRKMMNLIPVCMEDYTAQDALPVRIDVQLVPRVHMS
jgi:hypothetical protein